jgi:hypothetical protein
VSVIRRRVGPLEPGAEPYPPPRYTKDEPEVGTTRDISPVCGPNLPVNPRDTPPQ